MQATTPTRKPVVFDSFPCICSSSCHLSVSAESFQTPSGLPVLLKGHVLNMLRAIYAITALFCCTLLACMTAQIKGKMTWKHVDERHLGVLLESSYPNQMMACLDFSKFFKNVFIIQLSLTQSILHLKKKNYNLKYSFYSLELQLVGQIVTNRWCDSFFLAAGEQGSVLFMSLCVVGLCGG